MKKRFLFFSAILVLGLILSVALFYLYPKGELETTDLSALADSSDLGLFSVYQEASSLFSTMDAPVSAGPVYVLKNRPLIGAGDTVCFIPYVRSLLGDIGTAGTASWTFGCHMLVLTSNSASWERTDRFRIKASDFAVAADQNTVLKNFEYEPGYGSQRSVTLGPASGEGAELYTVQYNAITLDSSEAVNAECQAAFQWSGMILYAPGLIPRAISFTLNGSADYKNNVK